MSLQRFALYFLAVSVCAVVLFPQMTPTEAISAPPPPESYRLSTLAYAPPMRLPLSRKFPLHQRHLAPVTIAASN